MASLAELMIDPGQLEALSAAVAEGSFEGAARALHVTPSAVSQRIKALEIAVGRVVLVRSRPVRPTDSGRALLRAARQIDAVTQDVLHELGQADDDEREPMALAINADSLATWFIPALAEIEAPVAFDLCREDEEQTVELLREGSVMAAVTASNRPLPGCTVKPLGRMRYRPLAAERFAARWFPDGADSESLARAPLVAFDRSDGLQDRWLRRVTRKRPSPPRHYVPGSTAFLNAVRAGLGWGLVPELQAEPGTDGLVELIPDAHVDVRLYWQQWRLRSGRLDEVAAAVRRQARAALR
jgi:LysR family transcriptional regulator, chromosome initiation inhibitor